MTFSAISSMDVCARFESSFLCLWLADFSQSASGPIPGRGDALHAFSDIFVEHVRVTHGRLEVLMVERLLHELEVAGHAQKLGAEVMSIVVNAEADDT